MLFQCVLNNLYDNPRFLLKFTKCISLVNVIIERIAQCCVIWCHHFVETNLTGDTCGAMTFCQLDILSTWHFFHLLHFLHDIWSTCHFVNFTFHLLNFLHDILSTWHFINLAFNQLFILSMWHFVNLTFHQLVIWSMWHFIN